MLASTCSNQNNFFFFLHWKGGEVFWKGATDKPSTLWQGVSEDTEGKGGGMPPHPHSPFSVPPWMVYRWCSKNKLKCNWQKRNVFKLSRRRYQGSLDLREDAGNQGQKWRRRNPRFTRGTRSLCMLQQVGQHYWLLCSHCGFTMFWTAEEVIIVHYSWVLSERWMYTVQAWVWQIYKKKWWWRDKKIKHLIGQSFNYCEDSIRLNPLPLPFPFPLVYELPSPYRYPQYFSSSIASSKYC